MGEALHRQTKAGPRLAKNLVRFRNLVESIPLAAALIKPNGCFDFLNPAFVNMFGEFAPRTTLEQWIELSVGRPTEREAVKSLIDPNSKNSRAADVSAQDVLVRCGNNRTKKIRVNILPLARGYQVLLCAEDMKFEAGSSLEIPPEEYYLGLLDNLTDFLYTLDLDGNVLNVNRGAVRTLGYEPEEVIGKSIEKVIPPSVRKHIRENLLRVQVQGYGEGISKYMGRDGSLHYLEYRSDLAHPRIQGDLGQLQQALMNLCINAADAMPNGGEISMVTDAVEIDERAARVYDGLSPGTFLQISVEDDGEGMSEHVMSRIFEPFFTTKADGKGTGLGLSMVYSIVKSHAGAIRVYSEPGKGSVFRLMFPIATDITTVGERVWGNETPRASGAILVADDEEIIRSFLVEILEGMGFTVLSSDNGQGAVEIYRANWQEIDLVILDLVMPKLNGTDAFAEMKKLNPGVKAILTTGFSREHELEQEGVLGVLRKPYKVEELSQVVLAALSSEWD